MLSLRTPEGLKNCFKAIFYGDFACGRIVEGMLVRGRAGVFGRAGRGVGFVGVLWVF